MQPSGTGDSASPMVCSLWPPVYRCAVSIICTPAAAAALMNATFSRVWVSRLVPSPMRLTSTSPTFTELHHGVTGHAGRRHDLSHGGNAAGRAAGQARGERPAGSAEEAGRDDRQRRAAGGQAPDDPVRQRPGAAHAHADARHVAGVSAGPAAGPR